MKANSEPQPLTGDWRKSSRSNGTGNCVEVSVGPVVGVRDTKNRHGGVLVFGERAWADFLAHLKADRS
ncbi:uncharacterized protein DUF397 [Halopolyspora algeriensis]|uniref:Uncharacterized protein DUF397 n=1 Tax=Halopolyspora algeriensis TaxID=1500506 RepID=A0A368VTM7_9ACTN|nr:DUF397 domain-containing protein [Halopolyspora algeriensis]RCW42803.1 uncharacterized protein DUF397 [Halopolyspora algeriensis]TQM56727.1 uncharacterized protein DUF397 [Halopolyspora algeriensis]